MKTLRMLYLWAAIYTFVPVAIIVLAMAFLKPWMMIIVIFGGLILLSMVPRSINLLKCVHLLKSTDMLEFADNEDPNEGTLGYVISGHFVWGIANHTVVPLDSVASVQVSGRRYINSISKSNATLTVITKENTHIHLLHYSGLSLEEGLREINICISTLRKRIPSLQVK